MSVKATKPVPGDKSAGVSRTPTLGWLPGASVADVNGNELYFSSDADAVANRNPGLKITRTEPNYVVPALLDLGETYYWAVDTVNDSNTWSGDLWRFTVIDHLVVDDMESYTPWNIADNNIFDIWSDGYGSVACVGGNGTGSLIYLEQGTIYDGENSMILVYDNDGKVYCASQQVEIDRDTYSKAKVDIDDLLLPVDPDWTLGGAKALRLYFHGDPNNIREPMSVELTDSTGGKAAVKYGPPYLGEDVNDINDASWRPWNIALQDFNDGDTPVNLEDINSIAIIIGDLATAHTGNGFVYFDDIRLYTTRCVPSKRSAEFARVDYVGDECVIDVEELEIMFNDWLESDSTVYATAPDNANLVAWYEFTGDFNDSSTNELNGDPCNGAYTLI